METNELLFNIGALGFTLVLTFLLIYAALYVILDKGISFISRFLIALLSLFTLIVVLSLVLEVFNKIL